MGKRQIIVGMAILASIFFLNVTSVNAVWPDCSDPACHDSLDINFSVWNSTTSMHKDVNQDGVSNNSDCLTCHTPPGESPYMDCCTGTFDTPTYYCADCHVNSTPPVSGTPQVGEHHNGSSDVDTAVECWDCHVNNKLSATYSGGDFRAYNLTISDAAHYGVRASVSTSNCQSCHFNATNATTWGSATLVNNTAMSGITINDTATSGDCYLCHGDVSSTNFHNATVSSGTPPSQCTTCHDSGGLSWITHLDAGVFSGASSMHRDINSDGSSNGSDCQACHYTSNLNGSDMQTPMPTYYCSDCHANASPPVSGASQIAEHYNESNDVNTTAKCEDCHINSVLSASEDDGGSKSNISNVTHYGVSPTLDSTNCKTCHFDATNGSTWGNATQVNGTTMDGYPVTSDTTLADCRRCHGDPSASNFHNSTLNKSATLTTSDCKDCHFTTAKETTFAESEHGTQECALCKSETSPMNTSLIKTCGPNGACHNLTSSRYDYHSEKEIKCENTCHGDVHGVGKFKQACETCHNDKKKHVKPVLKGVQPYQTNETFRCVTCHSLFHEKDINEPSCTSCHDYTKLPKTGDVCEKCHDSIHKTHVIKQHRECTECHSNLHNAPKEVKCDKCHSMVKKVQSDDILIPHTDCRDCHSHYNKPVEISSFCMNCHKKNEGEWKHDSELIKNIHNEVKNASKNCLDCHEQGVSKKPRCTACHNVHTIHKEEKTCVGCHGLLEGERTHYTIICDTCHKREGERGASISNLLPKDVSVGITRPQACESCHKYVQKRHVTCDRCHGEIAPDDADLSSFSSISNSGVVIYSEDSSDVSTVDYLREGTSLRAENDLITAVGKHTPLYNTISLYWHDPLSFAYADRPKINATPSLNIYNVAPGLITNDTGNQYLIVEVDYPDVKMGPVIEKQISAKTQGKIVDDALKLKDNIKITYVYSAGNIRLYIIDGESIEGSVNITSVNATTDISDSVHEISDVLDGYDVFVSNVTTSSVRVSIADKTEQFIISDEQKNVLGYDEISITEDGSTISFNGSEITFIDGEMQRVKPKYDHKIILGGPASNPVAESENSKANIVFNHTGSKIELIVEGEKYACEYRMWKNEDYAILKIMKINDETSYIYAEGCTRYGTEAAVKLLKSESDFLNGKTTAIIYWKDFNGNGSVELNEVEIIYAF